mmetsp:Transcript_41740/g.131601  ORF Transcript_41740/g.131601 Transcript_41740/m.131601 type:complete len:218 (+) Transcript_41740:969-1622(+)
MPSVSCTSQAGYMPRWISCRRVAASTMTMAGRLLRAILMPKIHDWRRIALHYRAYTSTRSSCSPLSSPCFTLTSEQIPKYDSPAWTAHLAGGKAPQYACAVVRSLAWPGAVTVGWGYTFVNFYCGWGVYEVPRCGSLIGTQQQFLRLVPCSHRRSSARFCQNPACPNTNATRSVKELQVTQLLSLRSSSPASVHHFHTSSLHTCLCRRSEPGATTCA